LSAPKKKTGCGPSTGQLSVSDWQPSWLKHFMRVSAYTGTRVA
jgi:hypothetical protein